MIRIDAVWLATTPLNMLAGAETALARVVQVFGGAKHHHAYLFATSAVGEESIERFASLCAVERALAGFGGVKNGASSARDSPGRCGSNSASGCN